MDGLGTNSVRTHQRLVIAVPRALALVIATMLAGCSTLPSMPDLGALNPFKEEEEKLPGKRIPVLVQQDATSTELETAGAPVSLPPATANASWTQPGGVPSNAPGHLELAAAVNTAWTADAGTGSSSDGRLTASPVVYDGRIYTIDAEATVSAFSASGGTRYWRISLVPEYEDEEEGYGGGLAADSGRLIAATGFGTVVALNPQSGKKLWERSLGVPVRNSPTAADGKVFVSTLDGRFFCLSAEDGSELWSFRGLPQKGSIISNVSPAVQGNTVVVPYPSGEVVALDANTGETRWSDSLARSRALSSLSALSDPARPAIVGGTVFAVGHAGRMIASEQATGERIWSQNIRGTQTPWVAGDAVYLVDVTGKLMALSRSTGKIRWMSKLPGGGKWNGPVLAGSRLWLASSAGKLVTADAATGRVTAQRDLGQSVYIAPVVAAGRLYVLTDSAKLIALR
ncbi:MAG: PQQ-binding-like beta-propeller repeat protein [Hyphomicrobiaceae bacterium]